MAGLSEISREFKLQQDVCLGRRAELRSPTGWAVLVMGKIVIDEEYCKGCGLCISFCPQKVDSILRIRSARMAITRQNFSIQAENARGAPCVP